MGCQVAIFTSSWIHNKLPQLTFKSQWAVGAQNNNWLALRDRKKMSELLLVIFVDEMCILNYSSSNLLLSGPNSNNYHVSPRHNHLKVQQCCFLPLFFKWHTLQPKLLCTFKVLFFLFAFVALKGTCSEHVVVRFFFCIGWAVLRLILAALFFNFYFFKLMSGAHC